MIKEIVATTGVLLGFVHFLGFSLHAPWYRLFAFPFRPPQDLAFRERDGVLIATLSFAGGTLFWAFLAGLTLLLLASIYDRQGYSIDIPLLILFGAFAAFFFIAASTAFYLLVRAILWRPLPFIEIHGRRYGAVEIHARLASLAGRTWRLEPWRPGLVLVKKNGVSGFVEAEIGQTFDPAHVERIGQRGLDYTCCILCRWLLCRSDDSEHGRGYTDGEVWLCRECFEGLVKPVQDRFAADS